MLQQLSDSWMLKPENFRKLKRLRNGVRDETGQDVHINDENTVRSLIELARHSRNPRMKVMAEEMWRLLEANSLH